MRFDPAAGQPDLGTQLPPLRVSFASSQLVYPMRLTRLATTPQTVRLYVLADHRVTSTGTGGPARSDVTYAGWQDPASSAPALKALLPHRMFLTRFDQAGLRPDSVTDDYHFGFAGKDTTYQKVEVVGGGGDGFSLALVLTVILGVVGLLVLVAGVAVLVAVLVLRSRRRPGQP